jgi:hypothetical protein
MASLKGRYFSQRDLNMINSLNGELMGDIIENIAAIYTIIHYIKIYTILKKIL